MYFLIIKTNKLCSFSCCGIFLYIKKENMFSLIPLSYGNTHESLGELEKAVETLAC